MSLADDYAISTSSISRRNSEPRPVPGWTAEALDVSPAWLRSLQAEPVLWLRTRPGMRDNVSANSDTAKPGVHVVSGHTLLRRTGLVPQ